MELLKEIKVAFILDHSVAYIWAYIDLYSTTSRSISIALIKLHRVPKKPPKHDPLSLEEGISNFYAR